MSVRLPGVRLEEQERYKDKPNPRREAKNNKAGSKTIISTDRQERVEALFIKDNGKKALSCVGLAAEI